jgi:hypothetical protein
MNTNVESNTIGRSETVKPLKRNSIEVLSGVTQSPGRNFGEGQLIRKYVKPARRIESTFKGG